MVYSNLTFILLHSCLIMIVLICLWSVSICNSMPCACLPVYAYLCVSVHVCVYLLYACYLEYHAHMQDITPAYLGE